MHFGLTTALRKNYHPLKLQLGRGASAEQALTFGINSAKAILTCT